MMKTKRLISVLLAVLMLVSVVPFNASAAEEDAYVSAYDYETPVVLVHGIGQNDTYVLDENGNRQYAEDGSYLNGWPLEVNIEGALKTILPTLLGSVFLRHDLGLAEAMNKGAKELLFAVQKDNEGNYKNKVEVPCFRGSMAEMTKEMKDFCYSRIPVQLAGQIIGEDKVFYFGYDSLGDVEKNAASLHEYIRNVVMPKSGATKVNICPISMGGSVAVEYLQMFKEDYDIIKNIVYVVPAIDGSDIVGGLLTGKLSIEDNDALYFDLIEILMGENYTSYLINMLLRLLPKKILKTALYALADGAVDALVRTTTQLWALCPTEYYPEAREKWLTDDNYKAIREKVDYFMEARADFEKNQNELISKGASIYDIVCYDLPIFPLAPEYKTSNSDGIIQCTSTSMGATFADLGTTLGDGYKAKGTYCNNPAHNHLSPDGMVDPTTGLLPCTTWYFKGQSHEQLQYNDVCLSLATMLMIDDNMVDVYSNPEAYPQYNGERSIRNVDRMIEDYKKADKSKLGADKCAAIENAIAAVEAVKAETIINEAKWGTVESNLESAMIAAGLREAPKAAPLEDAFTNLTKQMNKMLNNVMK